MANLSKEVIKAATNTNKAKNKPNGWHPLSLSFAEKMPSTKRLSSLS
jgi:hypothetical protein